ncbi:MAG TPA: flagellar basal body rod C-terminal domain-containing protein [Ilumatobacter sp.]|nr:flagellar basal body rod C-terminal domain-containing protein [Ilumatobacter sp.]
MSEVFSTLSVARTGMGAYKLWIDAVADNVANIDNVTSTDQPAFAERFVVVRPLDDPGTPGVPGPAGAAAGDGIGRGVVVTGVQFGDPNGRITYEPNHPLADENGMVRRPDIDLSDQMVFIQVAQRGYQANINIFERAREAYEAALQIGK